MISGTLHDGIWNHQRLDCLFNRLFTRRSKKTSKLRVTGLCEGNSLVTHSEIFSGKCMINNYVSRLHAQCVVIYKEGEYRVFSMAHQRVGSVKLSDICPVTCMSVRRSKNFLPNATGTAKPHKVYLYFSLVWVVYMGCIKLTARNTITSILQWRQNGRDGVSNHQHHHWLFGNSLFR